MPRLFLMVCLCLISQASELLHTWEQIPVDDALELLSGAFASDVVRSYAVATLQKASDDVCYLSTSMCTCTGIVTRST